MNTQWVNWDILHHQAPGDPWSVEEKHQNNALAMVSQRRG